MLGDGSVVEGFGEEGSEVWSVVDEYGVGFGEPVSVTDSGVMQGNAGVDVVEWPAVSVAEGRAVRDANAVGGSSLLVSAQLLRGEE